MSINKIFISKKDKSILQDSFKVFFIKISAIIFIFLMNLFVVRSIGAFESGLFFLSMAITIFVANLSRLGLDQSLVKFISRINTKKEKDKIHSVNKMAITWSLCFSFITSSLVYIFSDFLSDIIFNKPLMAPILKIMSLSIIPIACFTLYGSSLQGLKKQNIAMSIISLIAPLLVVLIVSMLDVNSAKDVSIVYLAANLINLLIALISWKIYSPEDPYKIKFLSKELFKSSFPLWISVFFIQIISWFPLILLGVWASAELISLYQISNRIAALSLLLLFAVKSIVAPRISEAKTNNNIEQAILLSKLAIKISLLGSLPVFSILFVIPEPVLGLFGEEFKKATPILMILLIGTISNTLTGPVGALMAMTNNEHGVMTQNFFGAFMCIMSAIILIPNYGIYGAAISSSIAFISRGLMGIYQVQRSFNVNILYFWKT